MGTPEDDQSQTQEIKTGNPEFESASVSNPPDAQPTTSGNVPDWLRGYITAPGPISAETSSPRNEATAGSEDDPSTASIDAAVDGDDLARLAAALQAHDRIRRASPVAEDDRWAEIVRACCFTLIVGPSELGVTVSPSPLCDQVRAVLIEVGSDDLPEAQLCRLWLAIALGEMETDAANKIVALAKESLWWPSQALAYRVLAYYGCRKALADVLPKDGPLNLAQADAWLEAAHVASIDRNWVDRIVAAPDGPAPSPVCERWVALLKAETALICGEHPGSVEHELAAMAASTGEQPPRTYAEAELRRIASRAAAALARARLAQRRDDGSAVTSPAGQRLPAWEREYLQALARWQRNDLYQAGAGLEEALQRNPHQTAIRLALAALGAARSPEAALKALDCNEPTREARVARAALLARMGRYGEADGALYGAEKTAAGSEPGRYSWARGREQYRKQEQALRAALAERRGDWDRANKDWRAACAGGGSWVEENLRRNLREARRLFVLRRALESLAGGQTGLRAQWRQMLKHGCREIIKHAAAGQAAFFRAAAMMDLFPKRAVRDFKALLQQRDWVEEERSAGGGRLIFVGDALLRLGQAEDALQAYELARGAPLIEVKERQAVAMVYSAVMRRAEPAAISSAADRAADLAPSSPWPPMLAALGMIIAGEAEAAASRIAVARERGAPESACHYLQSMSSALSGASSEDLPALALPDDPDAVVRLLCGIEPAPERIDALTRTMGKAWMARCGADPYFVACQLLAGWCDEGRWDEAMKCADGLLQSGLQWAADLAALTRVRHALERACRNELEEANHELQQLEAAISQSIE